MQFRKKVHSDLIRLRKWLQSRITQDFKDCRDFTWNWNRTLPIFSKNKNTKCFAFSWMSSIFYNTKGKWMFLCLWLFSNIFLNQEITESSSLTMSNKFVFKTTLCGKLQAFSSGVWRAFLSCLINLGDIFSQYCKWREHLRGRKVFNFDSCAQDKRANLMSFQGFYEK